MLASNFAFLPISAGHISVMTCAAATSSFTIVLASAAVRSSAITDCVNTAAKPRLNKRRNGKAKIMKITYIFGWMLSAKYI